jgi:hypothetical protein
MRLLSLLTKTLATLNCLRKALSFFKFFIKKALFCFYYWLDSYYLWTLDNCTWIIGCFCEVLAAVNLLYFAFISSFSGIIICAWLLARGADFMDSAIFRQALEKWWDFGPWITRISKFMDFSLARFVVSLLFWNVFAELNGLVICYDLFLGHYFLGLSSKFVGRV